MSGTIFVSIFIRNRLVSPVTGIDSILLKNRGNTLKLPSCLSTPRIIGKVKILETDPKSEEIDTFIPYFFHLGTFIVILLRKKIPYFGFMSFTSCH